MSRSIATDLIDDGACIITGRRSQLDYHEPGEFRRSRDPGSHRDPNKRVLVWRVFHDRITFGGWRDELKDGRYRCCDDEKRLVRDVPVRLDDRLGGMVADWKDEAIMRDIAAYVPSVGLPSFAELRVRLVDCSDEAITQVYDQAEAFAERCYMLCCLSVAILRDRYRFEEWSERAPDWWRKDKPYPPDEPYWPHIVGRIVNRSWRTVYRRYQVWCEFEQIATNGNSPQTEEVALELGKQAWNVILKASDREATLVEAVDLKAETGEAKGEVLASRLQEHGLLQKAQWEYGCLCGCDWWGRQRDFRKRQVEAS